MATWLDNALRIIEDGMKDVPDDIPIEERKKLVRSLRHYSWSMTSHGRKTWPRAVKAYMARFVRSDAAVPEKHLSPLERMMKRAEGR